MSTKHPAVSEVSRRLAFFKGLQGITNRVHATHDIDEIMLEVSQEICQIFDAERLSIYAVDASGESISTKVKTGLHSVQNIRLPIAGNSIAGFVALTGQTINIADVYDVSALKASLARAAVST